MTVEQMEQAQIEVAQLEVESTEVADSESVSVAQIEAPLKPKAAAASAKLVEVEVKRWHGSADSRVFGWQRMPVKEALRLQEDTFRCPECLGRVRLRAASAEKQTIEHGEHYSKNTGCSLGESFDGTKKLHIKPIL